MGSQRGSAALVLIAMAGQVGCSTTASARNVRDGGLVLAGGGAFGLVAAGGLALGGAEPYLWQESLTLGSALILVGVLLAGPAHLALRAHERQDREAARVRAQQAAAAERRAGAWRATQAAAMAGRGNDCPTVVALAPTVLALDPAVHADVFVRDVAIARCLAITPSSSSSPLE